jgi:nicotinamide-nucleotide amidase
VELLNRAIEAEVTALADALRKRGWRLAAAESCTGGLIAAACTSIAGSSDWFERGFVTYSNAAKTELLGVDPALIARHGAVSEEVALAMAVTGIAGPGGAVPGKPVGTVWLAWGVSGDLRSECLQLPGDRSAVRSATVQRALSRLHERATA